MITRERFARYVKDALASFYDPAHLQTHHLADLLLSNEVPEGTKAMSLRQVLAGTVEALRPPDRVPFSRPEWLCYRLIRMCYVESLPKEVVYQELGLGRSTFYRYHRKALEAVVDIAWENYVRGHAPSEVDDGDAGRFPVGERAREEAIRIARRAESEWVDLKDLLEGVKEIIEPLAEQEGISVFFHVPPSLPQVHGDPALLRQIVLNVIAEAIGLAAGHALQVDVRCAEGQTIWRVRGLDTSKLSQWNLEASGLAVSRGLLAVYGGQFWLESEEGNRTSLCLAFPTAGIQTILVIDDDSDTIRLYRRYLREQKCMLWVARNLGEARECLARGIPDLVLLDVLMPKEDGWDILQTLRTAPETAKVPIVICSVLNQPRLALALGATEVLQKPIDRTTLLRTVRQLLTLNDRPEKDRQAETADT